MYHKFVASQGRDRQSIHPSLLQAISMSNELSQQPIIAARFSDRDTTGVKLPVWLGGPDNVYEVHDSVQDSSPSGRAILVRRVMLKQTVVFTCGTNEERMDEFVMTAEVDEAGRLESVIDSDTVVLQFSSTSLTITAGIEFRTKPLPNIGLRCWRPNIECFSTEVDPFARLFRHPSFERVYAIDKGKEDKEVTGRKRPRDGDEEEEEGASNNHVKARKGLQDYVRWLSPESQGPPDQVRWINTDSDSDSDSDSDEEPGEPQVVHKIITPLQTEEALGDDSLNKIVMDQRPVMYQWYMDPEADHGDMMKFRNEAGAWLWEKVVCALNENTFFSGIKAFMHKEEEAQRKRSKNASRRHCRRSVYGGLIKL